MGDDAVGGISTVERVARIATANRKSGKCRYCDSKATKRVSSKDGKDSINVCSGHVSMARRAMHGKGISGVQVAAMGKAMNTTSPGGRPADSSPTGTPGGRQNWVDRAGGLPKYMREVWHALKRRGMTDDRAYRTAVATVKKWAVSAKNPKVRAAAAAAVAQWERMKASHGKSTDAELLVEVKKQYNAEENRRRGEQQIAAEDRANRSGGKFEEGKHPRAGDGKFTSGTGSEDDPDAQKYRSTHKATLRKKLLDAAPLAPGAKGQEVRYLQDLLQQGGFGKFSLDGVYGPKTIAAIKKVQKEMGVAQTGKASADLIERLLNNVGEQDKPDGKKGHDGSNSETKEDGLVTGLEYKNVGVNGFKVLDPEEGIVETIVSVTGMVDNVKDDILVGAYAKTLAARTPKGVWGHDWNIPVSKTLHAEELAPGDPRLPTKTRSGKPWPKDAGGALVQTQFNLDTQRGREAFSDVKFFGAEQEWSIGYNVPAGGAEIEQKTGVRKIKTLDWYEYSPVLFGAMPETATRSVKTAQQAFLELKKLGFTTPAYDDMDVETKGADADGNPTGADEDGTYVTDVDPDLDEEGIEDIDEDDDLEEDDEDEEDEELQDEGKAIVIPATSLRLVEQVIAGLQKVLNGVSQEEAASFGLSLKTRPSGSSESKSAYGSVMECVEEHADVLTSFDAGLFTSLKADARRLDRAVDMSDMGSAEDAAGSLLDVVDEALDQSEEDGVKSALQKIAKEIGDRVSSLMDGHDDSDEEEKSTQDGAMEAKQELVETLGLDPKMLQDMDAFAARLD